MQPAPLNPPNQAHRASKLARLAMLALRSPVRQIGTHGQKGVVCNQFPLTETNCSPL